MLYFRIISLHEIIILYFCCLNRFQICKKLHERRWSRKQSYLDYLQKAKKENCGSEEQIQVVYTVLMVNLSKENIKK